MLGTSWDDPRTMATFNLAAGLLGGGNFGQALGRGLQGYTQHMQQAEELKGRKEDRAARKLLTDMQIEQMLQAAQKQKAQDAWRAQVSQLMNPEAMTPHGAINQPGRVGPTAGKAEGIGQTPAVDQAALMRHLLDPNSPFADELIKQKIFPKGPEYKVVGNSLLELGANGPREAYRAPEAAPNKVREYEFARQNGFNGSFEQFLNLSTPKTTVNNNVNTGRQDSMWGDAPSGMVWAKDAQGNTMLEQDPRTGAVTPRAIRIGGTASTAQTELDKKFAGEYADFIASGGVADVEKQLQQLRGVLNQLETDKTLTGPFRGMLPDTVRSVTNPQAVAAKNAVEEVVQRNLRVVLGAQFTEKEGERLIARAYNPQLSTEENAVRVRRLVEQIERMAQSKLSAAQHYEQFGTLQGWNGRLPKLSDINLDAPVGRGSVMRGDVEDLIRMYAPGGR